MDHATFYKGIRPVMGGELTQQQVDRINAILAAWEQYGDRDARKLAYILATAKHESANFVHMREIWGPTSAQSRYEGRADLGNTVKGDGKRFLGRGFVQITGRRNYSDWAKRVGLDIVSKPALAEGESLAARILVQGMMLGTFTGKKLADYPADFVESRRIVNGTDKAQMIAGYAYAFLDAIQKASVAAPIPVPKPTPQPSPATPEPPKKRGINWWAIAGFIAIILLAIAFLVPLPFGG